MINFSKRWIVGLSCVIVVPAYAQSSAGGQQATQSSVQEATQAKAETADTAQNAHADDSKGKLRCRYETITGSRFKSKICMTDEDGSEVRRATKEAMREVDNRPNPTRGSEG